MDALRLIKTARHALAETRSASDALAEAWQAGLLTEAVGGRIAERESGELGALGQLLCDAGAHAVGCLEQPSGGAAAEGGTEGGTEEEWSRGEWGGTGRASRLDELGELEPVLRELGRLLHEVAEALVVLACGADGERLYWRCIDGIDAGAECKDLVAELLRAVRRQSGDSSGEAAEESTDFPDEGDTWHEDEEWEHRRDGRSDEYRGRRQPSRERPGDEQRDAGRRTGADGVPESSSEQDNPEPDGARLHGARPHGAGTGPGADRCSEGSLPTLVIPLAPPGAAPGYRPGADESAEPSAAGSGPAWSGRVPEERRSAPSPASESLTEASSSCICSSRLLGVAAAGGTTAVGGEAMGTPAVAAVCGATGASDLGSDMRGALQLGSAV
ncbi:hypothetical protein GCM10010430_46500 [Kitasatospora cystarginea]|uniref:Uncharacterized protein n=1 Tax=Kitasatospora cystarginea TaxID=58350 RepID=A0ABP5RBX0_9ACTN